jgi:primosomal protein N' (replication factor Y)
LNTGKLECHHCGLSKQPPTFCPECRSLAIRFFGSGTERVEQEVKKIFSDKYTVSRMDRDTTKKTGSHGEIFESFADRKVDILIGTQMISKGFDLENVGMVGVISADTILNFPDYTANEQTFDLLTQVAGRTGRGQDQGKVIIQTYTPDNFAIRMAAKHDYEGFYKEEIKNRQELNYPPFATLIKMLYNNFDQNKAKSEAEEFINKVNEILSQNNIKYILLGPSPAFIPKKANNYYYQISIKILENTEEHIIQTVKLLNKITKNGWSIDVDPGDLL